MKKKVKLEQAINFTKHRLEALEHEFKRMSDQFIWQTQQGGGINNIHMLGTIRSLNSLYLDIAVHRDALRSLNVEI